MRAVKIHRPREATLTVIAGQLNTVITVVVRPTAKLVLATADISTTVGATRAERIWVAARHARERIRAADLVVTAAERPAGFTRIADALARGEIAVLGIGARHHTMAVAAIVIVGTAFSAAHLAIAAVTLTGRWVTRCIIQATIIAVSVTALLPLGATVRTAHVRWWADTAARVGIELVGRIARRADTLVVAAGCIVGADRYAFAERAHLAAGAGVAAGAAIFVVALGVDTLTIAVGPGVDALTLPKLAGAPRITGMTTRTAVVGVGANMDALPTAADFAGRAQAAIPVLTFLKPLVIEAVRSNLAAETRELLSRMEAEAVAGGLLVEEHVSKGGIFAMRDATASRGGSGCLNRSSDQRSDQAAQ